MQEVTSEEMYQYLSKITFRYIFDLKDQYFLPQLSIKQSRYTFCTVDNLITKQSKINNLLLLLTDQSAIFQYQYHFPNFLQTSQHVMRNFKYMLTMLTYRTSNNTQVKKMQAVKNSRMGTITLSGSKMVLTEQKKKSLLVRLFNRFTLGLDETKNKDFESNELNEYNNMVKARRSELQNNIRMFSFNR